jgi:hypothetical protein
MEIALCAYEIHATRPGLTLWRHVLTILCAAMSQGLVLLARCVAVLRVPLLALTGPLERLERS